MIKAVLFDADGVILKKYKEYFSERFAREYGAPIEEIRLFFKGEFPECQRGSKDLKVEFEKYLPKWGWQKSVDEFLSYWFTNDVIADTEVLKEVAGIRARGLKCYLATDQEKYRAEYLTTTLKLSDVFDDCFFSYDIRHLKSSPEYFKEILKRTGLRPEEIAYFDDDRKNVETAKTLGINAVFYTTIADLQGGGLLSR
jgi:putative hydrolase of the HAD superfamily